MGLLRDQLQELRDVGGFALTIRDLYPPPGSLGEIDIMPRAAYILGHHPYILGIWQETAFGDPERQAQADVQVEWDRFRRQLRELEDAVSDLVSLGLIAQDKLDQFVEYKDDLYHSVLNGLTGSGDYSRVLDPRTVVTGEGAWEMLTALSSRMLAPHLDLHFWRDLGGAVGAARFSFAVGDVEKVDFRLGAIRKCANEILCNDRFSSLRELVTRAGLLGGGEPAGRNSEGGGEPTQRPTCSHLEAFDEALRERLTKLPPAEPLLHLQTDKLIFFGQQHSFLGRNKSEIACLWLLAKQAPESVERDEMKTQGRMKIKKLNSIDEKICRLRRILRDLLEDLRDRVGRELSPYEEYGDCYIRAVDIRRSGDLLCCYKLELNPARVRVVGPRPPWMMPAAEE